MAEEGTTETAATTELEGGGGQQPSIFDGFKEKFGVDVADQDSLFTHYGQVAEQAKSVEGLKAQLEAANARTIDYPAPGIKEIADHYKALVDSGITDPRVLHQRMVQFHDMNGQDYAQLAVDNPAALIERGLRLKHASLNLTDAEFNHLLKAEGVVNASDYDMDDPEQKAEYDGRMLALRTKAKLMAPELEAARKSIDLKPAGIKTDAERQQEIDDINASYVREANAYKEAFKGVKVGDEILTVTPEEFQDYWDNFLVSGEADKTIEKLMDPSTPEGFREFAELTMLRRALPAILAREREKAHSDALKKFQSEIRSPGEGLTPEGGAGKEGPALDRAAVSELFKTNPIPKGVL